MDRELAVQNVRMTADWLADRGREVIRCSVDAKSRHSLNLLVLGDELFAQAEYLRRVQAWLEKE